MVNYKGRALRLPENQMADIAPYFIAESHFPRYSLNQ